jgi:hypothetical protein
MESRGMKRNPALELQSRRDSYATRLPLQSFQSAQSRECAVYVPLLVARNWGIRKTRVNRVLRGFHADVKQHGIKFKNGGSVQVSPAKLRAFLDS